MEKITNKPTDMFEWYTTFEIGITPQTCIPFIASNIIAPNEENAKEIANQIALNKINVINSIGEGKTLTIPKVFNLSVKKTLIVDDWGDTHGSLLRNAVNEIYAHIPSRQKLMTIMKALYERDCVELADYYSAVEECVWWKANEVSFEQMVDMVGFGSLCEEMCSHILDDEDFRIIIGYCRPHWFNWGCCFVPYQ